MLFRAKKSTELVELWHQAAAQLKCQGPERDRLWERLARRIDPLLSAQLRRVYRPDPMDCLDVEEVIQEVFLRLLKGDGRIMRRCSATNDFQLQSYLSMICESCLVDLIRFRRAKKRGFDDTVRFNHGDETRVPDFTQDVEHLIICRSELAGFSRAIRRCSLRSARNARRNCWIFKEALVQGRHSGELAGDLGLRPSSVDSVISRMKQDLRVQGWDVAPRVS